jgi:hypothetical protein
VKINGRLDELYILFCIERIETEGAVVSMVKLIVEEAGRISEKIE